LSGIEAAAVLVAGVGAGAINTVVGSGTLLTFPLLLAIGYGPVTANVSNTIGLAPGGFSGAFGYRRELVGQEHRMTVLLAASIIGGAAGAVLLLALPSSAFDAVVPVFIAVAVVLVIVQPAVTRRLASRPHGETRTGLARVGVLGSGVYGGYFGAAQGVLLMAVLGLTLPDHLQRTNALKNLLAATVNLVAGLIFVFAASVAWEAAALLAVGSIIGGQLGANLARRLSATALRGVVVLVGVIAVLHLTLG
jgi:uncharacterized membrane protein YfcA